MAWGSLIQWKAFQRQYPETVLPFFLPPPPLCLPPSSFTVFCPSFLPPILTVPQSNDDVGASVGVTSWYKYCSYCGNFFFYPHVQLIVLDVLQMHHKVFLCLQS